MFPPTWNTFFSWFPGHCHLLSTFLSHSSPFYLFLADSLSSDIFLLLENFRTWPQAPFSFLSLFFSLDISFRPTIWNTTFNAAAAVGLYIFSPNPSSDLQTHIQLLSWHCCCCCSVTKLCPTLCDPLDCKTPGFPVLAVSRSWLRFLSIELVMLSNHLILFCPLLPSVFPSIRVFSNESAQMAKILELQLQHQSFQWIFRVDFL